MNPALRAGRRFPDVELIDHAGNPRRLSDLTGGDPTLLQFYRGWWCPKEQAFMRLLVDLQQEAEVAYTRFVSVSVDPAPVAAAFRAGLGARWTFASDAERAAQRLLGLRESTDTVYCPYVPTVFTMLPDLTIHRVYDGYWFWGGRRSRSCAATSATSRAACGRTGRRPRRELVLARAVG